MGAVFDCLRKWPNRLRQLWHGSQTKVYPSSGDSLANSLVNDAKPAALDDTVHIAVSGNTAPPATSLKDDDTTTDILEDDTKLSRSIHALLIGINKYPPGHTRVHELQGAIQDVEHMYQFLTRRLSTPMENIKMLRDEEATYSQILRSIDALGSVKTTKPDSPILIYFAGHGSTISTPASWAASSVQAILPYDVNDGIENVKHAIADMVLGYHIKQLAKRVGRNITVILDCCHSASGIRAEQVGIRGHNFDGLTLSESLGYFSEQALVNDTRGVKASTFASASYQSYTLLAACGTTEQAREKDGRGVFTTALLDLLARVGTESHTCAQLISSLGRLGGLQSPACEGASQNRTIFNDYTAYYPRWHPVRLQHSDNIVLEDTGELQGIEIGSKFDVYDGSKSLILEPPICQVVVKTVRAVTCECTLVQAPGPIINLPSFAIAVEVASDQPQPAARILPVWLGQDNPRFSDPSHTQVSESLDQLASTTLKGDIEIVKHREDAFIGIDIQDGEVNFPILHRGIRKLSGEKHTHLSFSLPVGSNLIEKVLRSATHFFWHLRRLQLEDEFRSKLSSHSKLDPVKINVHKLTETTVTTEAGRSISAYAPQAGSGPLSTFDGSDTSLWTVVVTADDAQHYGVELDNTQGKLDLFVSTFYFDCSTLEISMLSNSPMAASETREDAPLKAGCKFATNFGAGDGRMLQFQLSDQQDVDFGYLVIFLSSSQFDLSHIERPGFDINAYQPSQKPFPHPGSKPQNSDTRGLKPMTQQKTEDKSQVEDKCGVLVLPILTVRSRL